VPQHLLLIVHHVRDISNPHGAGNVLRVPELGQPSQS
jgi:hypothetical protein